MVPYRTAREPPQAQLAVEPVQVPHRQLCQLPIAKRRSNVTLNLASVLGHGARGAVGLDVFEPLIEQLPNGHRLSVYTAAGYLGDQFRQRCLRFRLRASEG